MRIGSKWGGAVVAALVLAAGAIAQGGHRFGSAERDQPVPDVAFAQGGTPVLPTPTPLVVPVLTPSPLYLPLTHQEYDPLLPGPIESRAEGYLTSLTASGKRACAPATHVLLRDPEGSRDNEARAVLSAARSDPDLNLDLYVGEYVELTGTTHLTPPDCDVLTWRHIAVGAIREKEVGPR